MGVWLVAPYLTKATQSTAVSSWYCTLCIASEPNQHQAASEYVKNVYAPYAH